ncbi:TetR/AcrR family transcriptional regulator [Catellatospora paridis]|uniref:TetR/AcrR family transcriptional regulator n=1 Tax=Catellatospora paridis TaxID=1617086 RepID=UPI0012D3BD2E|nr:TetR/AcrR family transcriptional regulator [Catellatospora paridis]
MAQNRTDSPSRQERRKARTRAALIKAAQSVVAAGRLNAPILEITQAADVGMGSFYNHFDSREQLFRAAVDDALERHGNRFDEWSACLDDPAHAFAQSFRLTGRIHRREPALSQVLFTFGLAMAAVDNGLARRASRDIDRAVLAGRFVVPDTDLAMVVVAGAVLCLGRLLHDQPERDHATSTDHVAQTVLRMLGMPGEEASEICQRPLPSLDDPP